MHLTHCYPYSKENLLTAILHPTRHPAGAWLDVGGRGRRERGSQWIHFLDVFQTKDFTYISKAMIQQSNYIESYNLIKL